MLPNVVDALVYGHTGHFVNGSKKGGRLLGRVDDSAWATLRRVGQLGDPGGAFGHLN
jgi:hypothetical protein